VVEDLRSSTEREGSASRERDRTVTERNLALLPRGTVTFFFSDIEGSSDLLRRVGDEMFAVIRGDHRRLVRGAFATHGGREVDTAGDGFFVAFDSARSAVSAAVSAQRTLAAFRWPTDAEVRVRMGLHTAEPLVGEDGYVGIGVHRAARICDAARGGQVLISNATAGIIEDAELPGIELVDLGTHRLKDLPREQRLFQVTVEGLRSEFDRPRTADPAIPGIGTFLATDILRFRQIIQSVGDEASAALAADYQRIVSAVIEANDGAVLERVGDNALAVFRDAGDALRAAAAIREAFADFDWPGDADASVMVAIHSGRWSGDPTRVAASTALYRLTQFAHTAEPGQVLVSAATAALLEGDMSIPPLSDLGPRTIPGLDEPLHLYELPAQRH
jgi:class 3 adenylate cyclase